MYESNIKKDDLLSAFSLISCCTENCVGQLNLSRKNLSYIGKKGLTRQNMLFLDAVASDLFRFNVKNRFK